MNSKKKISKKELKDISKTKEKVENAAKVQTNEGRENSSEYGGLPQMDLKKNLGCG